MSTSLSVRATRVMMLERFQPHDYTWYFALSLVSLGSSILGILGWTFIHQLSSNWTYRVFESFEDNAAQE